MIQAHALYIFRDKVAVIAADTKSQPMPNEEEEDKGHEAEDSEGYEDEARDEDLEAVESFGRYMEILLEMAETFGGSFPSGGHFCPVQFHPHFYSYFGPPAPAHRRQATPVAEPPYYKTMSRTNEEMLKFFEKGTEKCSVVRCRQRCQEGVESDDFVNTIE